MRKGKMKKHEQLENNSCVMLKSIWLGKGNKDGGSRSWPYWGHSLVQSLWYILGFEKFIRDELVLLPQSSYPSIVEVGTCVHHGSQCQPVLHSELQSRHDLRNETIFLKRNKSREQGPILEACHILWQSELRPAFKDGISMCHFCFPLETHTTY